MQTEQSQPSRTSTAARLAAIESVINRLLEATNQLAERDQERYEVQSALSALGERQAQELAAVRETVRVSGGLDAIGKGLADMIEQFAPLRQLVPPRTTAPMPQNVAVALAKLRSSLRSPDWNLVDSLPVQLHPVPYIGQVESEPAGASSGRAS